MRTNALNLHHKSTGLRAPKGDLVLFSTSEYGEQCDENLRCITPILDKGQMHLVGGMRLLIV